jgi:propionyl-CoA synthetase
MSGSYREAYEASTKDPNAFWLAAADSVDWIKKPTKALDDSTAPVFRWYPDTELNTCYNAIDRHVLAGRGDQTAIIYDSAMTGTKKFYTYNELLEKVSMFAGALAKQGISKGDRVLIYMPMIPEAIYAMLACARLGAIHSVVFGGFAANELAVRIDDATPKVIVTSSGGFEPGRHVEYLPIIEKALSISKGSVETVIVHERASVPGSVKDFDEKTDVHWLSWKEAVAGATPHAPVPVAAQDPLYILYTSGTTGNPKGIVRDNGGHAVAMAWSMKNVYNIDPGDVMWAASDVGWVVGHSYIVYAPLIAGATTVLYEGKPIGTPDAGAFWRVASEHSVKVLFTAPTAIRAIRRMDPELEELARYNISKLETLFLAGERLDTETYHWANDGLHCPVVDNWWQTETGWPIAANPRGLEQLPVKPGSPSVPVPGYNISVVDSKGAPIKNGRDGNIVISLPMPPGTLAGLWGRPDGYKKAYLNVFAGFYATGDSGRVDDDGYVYVMGRTDDVINVAGHRLSTGQLEEAIAGHEAVAECAVTGVKDELKGQRAVGFITFKHGYEIDEAKLRKQVIEIVRDVVGPVAAFKDVVILQRLPKTRSGKVLRKTMRQIVDGENYTVPPTIEDPTVLDDLKVALTEQYHPSK